ncbi:MAG: choice-of-anchor tandem repeat NxxGxxAF-containing protein [Planctomycetota bacterium]
MINAAGDVAFAATALPVDSTFPTREVLYKFDSGGLSLVAAQGEVAPGEPAGTTFRDFPELSLGSTGEVVFVARSSRPDLSSNSGIYRHSAGSVLQLVRSGEAVPDAAPGATFGEFIAVESSEPTFVVLPSGAIRFRGSVLEPGNPLFLHVVYELGNGQFSKVTRNYDLVNPNSPTGARYATDLGTFTPTFFSPNGDFVFRSFIYPNEILDVSTPVLGALLVSRDDRLSPIGIDSTPGTPSGASLQFERFSLFAEAINAENQVVFTGRLEGPGTNSGNDWGVYFADPVVGTIELFRAGQRVPGESSDGTITGFGPVDINDQGEIAIVLFVDPDDPAAPTQQRLYRVRPGESASEAARSGNTISANGIDYSLDVISDLDVNNNGVIAFTGDLKLLGAFGTRGIYASYPDGSLAVVAQGGQQIEVGSSGEIQTLGRVAWFPEGLQRFNDQNQLLFHTLFVGSENDIATTSHYADGLFIADLTLLVLPGDGNGDGVIDLLDFDILAQNFGQATAGGASAGDFNGDGVVDLLDFDVLAQNFGSSSPATLPGVAPEPASVALLGLAGPLLLRRRRRAGLRVRRRS